jgi:nucleoside-diphosphate-sugar epimerase
MGSDKDSGNLQHPLTNTTTASIDTTTIGRDDGITAASGGGEEELQQLRPVSSLLSSLRGRTIMNRMSSDTTKHNHKNDTRMDTTTTTTTTTSSSSKTNPNHTTQEGLHQRRVTRSSSHDGMVVDEYERGYGGTGMTTLQQQQQSKLYNKTKPNRSRTSMTNTTTSHLNRNQTNHRNQNMMIIKQWLRTCIIAGIPAYLILLVLFLHQMNTNNNGSNKNSSTSLFSMMTSSSQQQVSDTALSYVNSQHYYSIDTPYIRNLYLQCTNQRKERYIYDEQDTDLFASKQNIYTTEQSKQRRQRTKPPSFSNSNHIEKTKILSLLEWERPITQYDALNNNNNPQQTVRTGLLRPSLVDEICGKYARTVVTEQQEQESQGQSSSTFIYRDTLLMPKPRVTRVLITGILQQPAFMLAIALKEQCNVDVIIGFDSMYPNSIQHRLYIQEQMSIITNLIPKLVKPIFISHIGIDPIRHAKMFTTLYETNEIDIVASLTPTHIVHFNSYHPTIFQYNTNEEWKNTHSPYVRDRSIYSKSNGNTVSQNNYNTPLYSLRNNMLSIEQILASIANTNLNDRPHLIYASSSSISLNEPPPIQHQQYDTIMHTTGRQIDEVMADYYYQQYGVTSIGLRLPNTIYGPWNHKESILYRVIDAMIHNITSFNSNNNVNNNDNEIITKYTKIIDSTLSNPESQSLDMIHVNDVVDATIAAMQYRSSDNRPNIFDVQSGEHTSIQQIHNIVSDILDPSITSIDTNRLSTVDKKDDTFVIHRQQIQKAIGWLPQISLMEGFIRTVAWHVDRIFPYGPPLHNRFNKTISATNNANIATGDSILKRHSVTTCSATDYTCHGKRVYVPCASECSIHDQCIPTVFDVLLPMIYDLTEECDVVLYTYDFDVDVTDLTLQSEYIEGNKPQICNFAFVRGDSPLVDNVIQKVPESELSRLGVDTSLNDTSTEALNMLKTSKHDKLNGRLLYRGWILIWTYDTPETLSVAERFLLKLSPGKLFHPDVQSAVFIDQGFGVSPRADDVLFLTHEMNREPWKARIVKRKNRPKAKFLLPSEPQRKAIILMSELKKQDSSEAERLAPEEKITTYEATRFMRYSNGEEPLGKEPIEIKVQREFYDRIRASINPDHARGPSDPIHKFELNHWVRSRWVAHDMLYEESRQLRCDWYNEHIFWGSDLDQLSFAYVMQKLELERKLEHNEPDETAQKVLSERTEMKKLLSDTFEWHALKLPQNKKYSPYEEMQILPYDMDNTEEREILHTVAETIEDGPDMPLFVRIISDRIMAYARKAWSSKAKDNVDEGSHKGDL